MNVYHYDDYRVFLRDYYESQKSKSGNKISFRILAKRAGLSAPNFLHLVMKGERNLSPQLASRLVHVLGLEDQEGHFFETLVHFNQALSPEEKVQAFQKMISFREFQEAQKIEPSHYAYYENWYCPVIREIVVFEDFQEDARWISERFTFPVSISLIEKALKDLQDMDFLTRDAEGRLRKSHPHLATDLEIASPLVARYHKEMIAWALLSFRQPARSREITSITMSLSETLLEEIRKRVQKFEKDLQQLLATSPASVPNRVCQLNFQLFTVLQSASVTSRSQLDVHDLLDRQDKETVGSTVTGCPS